MKATIVQVGGGAYASHLIDQLLEMGFTEGSSVEVLHEAPYGRDPITVRVRGSLIALRRQEANAIEVSFA